MTQIIPLPPSLRGHYAGFVTRSIAFAIDLLLIVVTQLVTLVFIRLILDFFGLDQLAQAIFEPDASASSSPFILLLRWGVTLFSSSILFAIYAITLWLVADKTLGQALMGLRVVRTNGYPVTFRPALRRFLGYYLSFFTLGIGFLWVLVDDRRQGWHDKIADTVVVYDWDARLGRRLREWLADQQESRRTPAITPAESQENTPQG